VTEKVAAVTVAVVQEATEVMLQAMEAKTVAMEVVEETEIVATVDPPPPPRAASVPAVCALAEQGEYQDVDDRQQPCWRHL
jgi:hypothetical protein